MKALPPPCSRTARATRATSAGRAQKSPQTQSNAAPICWSANGESEIPRQVIVDRVPRRRGEDAERHRQEDHDDVREQDRPDLSGRLVSFGLIGCDGMIWSQNRTPVTKNEACISQM